MSNITAPSIRSDSETNNLKKIADINLAFKERDIKTKAKQGGFKYIDLKNIPLNQDALQLTSWREVEQYHSVPFDLIGKDLHLACIDPASQECKNLVEKYESKGYTVELYICSSEGIQSTRHYFESFEKSEEGAAQMVLKEKTIEGKGNGALESKIETFKTGTGPEMISALNLMSAQLRASDIHFQPEEGEVIVRVRKDGQLFEIFRMSEKQFLLLGGEIKRAAGLKINIQHIPQDGQYQYVLNDQKIGVRVSTLPSKYGESMVLRILDARNAVVDIDQLGFSEEHKEAILKALGKDSGLILVTGPTGSGKTSTLYSCLNVLNTPEKKIVTLENPVEFEIKNITQSEIHEEDDYGFSSGLRAILRHDPDIIMVGEVRDKETAEIALQAALTGHLVLSTLHANDALLTIPRLLNIGVKPYIVALGIELIIAQRLVRRLCPQCKVPAQLSESERNEIEQVKESLSAKGRNINDEQIYAPKGCEECNDQGYEGRIAIAEVLTMSDSIRRAILEGETVEKMVQKTKNEGFLRLKEDGIQKVLQGLTSLEEVWKVLI